MHPVQVLPSRSRVLNSTKDCPLEKYQRESSLEPGKGSRSHCTALWSQKWRGDKEVLPSGLYPLASWEMVRLSWRIQPPPPDILSWGCTLSCLYPTRAMTFLLPQIVKMAHGLRDSGDRTACTRVSPRSPTSPVYHDFTLQNIDWPSVSRS